jgi:predicted nucleic acid-binding protein
MLDKKEIVIDTGPIIALVAALGDLSILRSLYHRVLVPYEVCQEILVGGPNGFAVNEFEDASWLENWRDPLDIAPILINSLDIGEASVIQLALNEKIRTVCIDEPRGRCIARLSGLSLTGSIGILLLAKREGHPISIQSAIQRMQQRGVWLSERVIAFALKQAGEEEN